MFIIFPLILVTIISIPRTRVLLVQLMTLVYLLFLVLYNQINHTTVGHAISKVALFLSPLKQFCTKLINRYTYYTVQHLDDNHLVLTYKVRGETYKQIINITPKPCNILIILDENEKDRTDEVLPYLGVQEDIHKSNIRPDFFGATSLTFENGDGNTITIINKKSE